MVYLRPCTACRLGQHSHCEGSRPAPPGYFGGSACNCSCRLEPIEDKLLSLRDRLNPKIKPS